LREKTVPHLPQSSYAVQGQHWIEIHIITATDVGGLVPTDVGEQTIKGSWRMRKIAG
jgi:hypothetical protein